MKRDATQLFMRQSKNRAFFQNYVDLRPPGKTEERKPDPWGNKNVRIPGARPRGGGGGGWSGLELTDT